MTAPRDIQRFIMDWQDIVLSVSYEADWLSMGEHGRYSTAHLQVEAILPARAPLPISETGYRSHFVPREQVEEHGGPVAFVGLWIEGASKSITWRNFKEEQRRLEAESRQLSLF